MLLVILCLWKPQKNPQKNPPKQQQHQPKKKKKNIYIYKPHSKDFYNFSFALGQRHQGYWTSKLSLTDDQF